VSALIQREESENEKIEEESVKAYVASIETATPCASSSFDIEVDI